MRAEQDDLFAIAYEWVIREVDVLEKCGRPAQCEVYRCDNYTNGLKYVHAVKLTCFDAKIM